MKPLLSNVIFDIVRPELPSQRRRKASRALRKIAGVFVLYDKKDGSVRVRLMTYMNVELTSAEEDVVLEVEDILVRNADRLLDALAQRANA